jgi:hypothetical protein
MSGSEELAQAEDEQGGEGGEDYEGNDDGEELAAMQKELEKAEQQKAELDKLNKMQGTASADSKQGQRPGSLRCRRGKGVRHRAAPAAHPFCVSGPAWLRPGCVRARGRIGGGAGGAGGAGSLQ